MISHEVIGSSPKFQAVLDAIKMVAPVDCTVLLQGETGTGKDVVAHAIHDAGMRRHNPFVALSCAAVPADLLESELFGHEKGAFTGASTQTTGRFESADRGTLFLDEIADLPLELQPKLLRVLQEQQFERLGSGRTTKVDVRVIAATNQDLWQMVRENAFRPDLFYRLNVLPIELPPLRERKEDIPALAKYFVRMFAERHHKCIADVSEDLMQELQRYDWPGNIRELKNLIERAVIMTNGCVFRRLAADLRRQEERCATISTLVEAERAHIIAALQASNWVIGGRHGAAFHLGLPRTTLITKMRRLGISRETVESRAERLARGIRTSSRSATEASGTGNGAAGNRPRPARFERHSPSEAGEAKTLAA